MKRVEIQKLQFHKLDFGYSDLEVFKQLDFTFDTSAPMILQAPTGGGKNTLMKILLGLASPTNGEYKINDQVVNGLSHSEFDSFRLNMGFSFDVGGLINNRTLYENFILPIDFHNFMPTAQKKDYIISFFERFGISEHKHIRPAFVSAGTRKLAAVLKAFLLNPQMIILNNPTLGLNSEHVDPLVELIGEYRNQKDLKYLIVATDDQHFIEMLNGEIYHVTKTELLKMNTVLKKVS